jgi:hypothetical protein
MAEHRQIDAAVGGRIYVSSRTLLLKNGMLATEEGSIYASSSVAGNGRNPSEAVDQSALVNDK